MHVIVLAARCRAGTAVCGCARDSCSCSAVLPANFDSRCFGIVASSAIAGIAHPVSITRPETVLHDSAAARCALVVGSIKINSPRCATVCIDANQYGSDPQRCDRSTTKTMGGPGLGLRAAAGRALWRGRAGRATEPPCAVPASRPMRVTITPAGLAVSATLRWRRRRCCDQECELQQEFDETQHCCRHAGSALRRHRTQATNSALRASLSSRNGTARNCARSVPACCIASDGRSCTPARIRSRTG